MAPVQKAIERLQAAMPTYGRLKLAQPSRSRLGEHSELLVLEQVQEQSKHGPQVIRNTIQGLGRHNHGVTKSTKNRESWELVYQEQYSTRLEAMRREKFLKSGRGREELRSLLVSRSVG
jgi:hypothetical protein